MSNFVACDSIDVNGTSYQGIVTTTFDELVKCVFDMLYSITYQRRPMSHRLRHSMN